MPSVVALIPARSGSKRLPNKNIRQLGGSPLLAYTIHAALESGVFPEVVVSTDSPEYAEIAARYGAYPILRPARMAEDMSPDIEWVRHALSTFLSYDAFSILRPTSPFRTPLTIRHAWAEFTSDPDCDSLRAVQRVRQHPGKMWVRVPGSVDRIVPLWHETYEGNTPQPYHSMPTQALPEVLVQSAALEIAWTRVVPEHKNISGVKIRPFFMDWPEDLDLNTEDDFLLAEAMVASGRVRLPKVEPVGVRT